MENFWGGLITPCFFKLNNLKLSRYKDKLAQILYIHVKLTIVDKLTLFLLYKPRLTKDKHIQISILLGKFPKILLLKLSAD